MKQPIYLTLFLFLLRLLSLQAQSVSPSVRTSQQATGVFDNLQVALKQPSKVYHLSLSNMTVLPAEIGKLKIYEFSLFTVVD